MVWSLLQRYKQGLTVLFTTHHMYVPRLCRRARLLGLAVRKWALRSCQSLPWSLSNCDRYLTCCRDEADLLGDRIAVMVQGSLRVFGTPMYLKGVYGLGYRIRVSSTRSDDSEEVGAGARSTADAAAGVPGLAVVGGVDVDGLMELVARHVPAAVVCNREFAKGHCGQQRDADEEVVSAQALLPKEAVAHLADLLDDIGTCSVLALGHATVEPQDSPSRYFSSSFVLEHCPAMSA